MRRPVALRRWDDPVLTGTEGIGRHSRSLSSIHSPENPALSPRLDRNTDNYNFALENMRLGHKVVAGRLSQRVAYTKQRRREFRHECDRAAQYPVLCGGIAAVQAMEDPVAWKRDGSIA